MVGVLAQGSAASVRVERLLDRPIITPQLHESIGPNIQGPSLIRVPEWVEAARHVLPVLADHKGRYIRLAYADNLWDRADPCAGEPAARGLIPADGSS